MKQYASLPDELTLRKVRVQIAQKDFRTRSLVVATTLLDAERYGAPSRCLGRGLGCNDQGFAQGGENDGAFGP